MDTRAKVDVTEFVNNSKIGGFQWGLFVLCGLCLIMDGFDVQALGYVTPALITDWKIPNSVMGPVGSAALVGILFGSILTSMLADRIGRRPVLLASTIYFAAAAFLTARVTTVSELLLIRFLSGLGLGAIMPNAMSLVGEYSPRKLKVTVMIFVSNGFNVGAAFGGLIAAWLIPSYGWRSVFYFGATVPLVLFTLMFFLLPESVQFLAVRRKSPQKIARWLRKMDPGAAVDEHMEFVAAEKEKKGGVPIVHLFHDGRALGTSLLWIVNFMNLLNLYFLSFWLPVMVRDFGYTTRIGVLAGTMVQVGGVIGTLALGWAVRRMGFNWILTSCFALSCVSIATIGQPGIALSLLFLVIFAAGWGVQGGQSALNSLAATYYPTDLRSTGIGAALGVGRMGSIVGPVMAGELMAWHWQSRDIFRAAAVPALIATVVMFTLRWIIKPQAPSEVAAAEVLAH